MRFAPRSRREVDVVVVGGGPAGAVTATELAKAGLSVLILERHAFPRYHIGESLTATAADIVREYGLAEALDRHQFPVKTGVKVVGTSARSAFYVPAARQAWQVRRSEFDKLLLDHAVASGAEHVQGSVKQVLREDGKVVGVAYRPSDRPTDLLTEVRARCVVDASGHSVLLSRHKVAGPRRVDTFGRQIALFTQFEGAKRDEGAMGDNTLIFYGSSHHWAWFIPLSPTVTSVGVVMPTTTYKERGGTPEAAMGWGLSEINPELRERVEGLGATEPIRVIRNYSYRVDPFVGDGWLCVGDAHRFADPIFSFGVAFAMTEGKAAAKAVLAGLEAGSFDAPFAEYARYVTSGQDAAFDLIRYFWQFPAFFSFQTRGDFHEDMIQLFSGNCFDADDLPALKAMRASLRDVRLTRVAEARAEDLVRRVYERYVDFQGIEAAYVQVSEDGIRLAFVLSEPDVDLYDHLCDFEEQLYADFGRDDLAVVSFTPELSEGLPVGHPRPEQPGLWAWGGTETVAIFDRENAR